MENADFSEEDIKNAKNQLMPEAEVKKIIVEYDENKTNEFLIEAKPKIQEITELVHGISEQVRELTPIWVEKFREVRNMFVRKQLESLISSVLFWVINIKVIKRVRKTKVAQFAWKGLTLLQNIL